MGTSLFNTTPAATYPALIKVGDNTSIDGTLKTLSDGAGNDLPIQVSSTVTNFTGTVGIGTTAPISPLNLYNSSSSVSSIILVEQDTSAIIGQINQYRKNGSANLTSGTEIGRLSFGGYFNSTYSPFSQVCSAILGYYGGTGTDRTGGLRLTTWNGGGATTRLQVAPDGKVSIGTTGSNAKLQIVGEGQTSGTTSLLVQNSIGSASLTVYDDRIVEVPYRIHTPFIRNQSGNLVLYSGSFEVEIQSNNPTSASGSLRTTGDITTTDNQTKSIINVNNLVSSTPAAFNTLNGFAFTSTITQTTGTIRGLFINPTLNASTDFRAIETVRGNVLLATTSGNVGVGLTAPTARLQVQGSGTTSATTSLLVQNSTPSTTFSVNDAGDTTTLGNATFGGGFVQVQGAGGVGIFASTYNSVVLRSASAWGLGNNTGNIGSTNGTIDYSSSYTLNVQQTNILRCSNMQSGSGEGRFVLQAHGNASGYNALGNMYIAGGRNTNGGAHGNVYLGVDLTGALGNVGVGLTAPTARLQVKGSGTTSGTTAFLVQNSTPSTTFSVTDDGAIVCGIGGQGSVQLGTLNLSYPSTISYPSVYGLTISPSTAGTGVISVDGSSMRFLASNNGITFSQPSTKSFLIKKEQGGADATSFFNISGADQTDAGQGGAGGVVRIFGGLNNGIAAQGLLVLAHNGTTTQGAVVVGGTSVNASALMDIQSTTKGFLPPRMTTAERVAISSPANGLIVFDTDVQNLCYRRDSTWVQVSFTAV